MQGPVVQPFAYDEAHPYATGQHRGIDIGADACGRDGGRAGGRHGQLRGHRADERQVGHDRDGGRLLGHAHAPRLDRSSRTAQRSPSATRSARSVRAARPRWPGRTSISGSVARPMRTATSIHSSSCRRSRTAVRPRAIRQHRSQARAAVRRPHLRPARARRLRRRPRANPLAPGRGAGACRPGGVDRLETASRGSNHAHERSQEPRPSRSRQRPGEEAMSARASGAQASSRGRPADELSADGRSSSRRLPSSRSVSTPATRSGRPCRPRSLAERGQPPCLRCCPQRRRSPFALAAALLAARGRRRRHDTRPVAAVRFFTCRRPELTRRPASRAPEESRTGARRAAAGSYDAASSLGSVRETPQKILVAVAWPYASGPRHLGHVAGPGVPSDVFARYHRLKGNDVLMVSGTDEHGTPVMVVGRPRRRDPARARRPQQRARSSTTTSVSA